MAAITVAPFVLKDAIFTVGTDSYEAHVSTVHFTPNVDTIDWIGLTPSSSFSDTSSPKWQCEMSLAQDWTTTNSLANYLLTNAGQQKVAVFKPKGATTGSPIFTATLTLMPPEIGGDVNTVQVSSVTCGVVGAPVKSVAP